MLTLPKIFNSKFMLIFLLVLLKLCTYEKNHKYEEHGHIDSTSLCPDKIFGDLQKSCPSKGNSRLSCNVLRIYIYTKMTSKIEIKAN